MRPPTTRPLPFGHDCALTCTVRARPPVLTGVYSHSPSPTTPQTNEMTTSDKYMSTSIRIGHACGYDGGTGTTKVVITFPQFDDWAITSVRRSATWRATDPPPTSQPAPPHSSAAYAPIHTSHHPTRH